MIKKRIFPETNLAFQCVTEGCSNEDPRREDGEIFRNVTLTDTNASQSTNDRGDLRTVSQRANQPDPLTLTPLLFIFPLGLSVVLTYLVTMVTTWQVGLSIGHVAMFLQVAVLAVIIVGSRIFQHRLACRASIAVAQFMYWLRLLLQVCFCYPVDPLKSNAVVHTVIIYHRLWPSSTPDVLLFTIMEKMWSELVGLYGEFPVRIQRVAKPAPNARFRFRRLCCLPSFVVLLAFVIALIVNTTIVRFNVGKLTHALSNSGLLGVFASMCFVLFLSLFGSLPSLWRLCRQGLMVSPARQLRDALIELLSEDRASKDLLTLMVKKDRQSRLKNGISSRLCFKQAKEHNASGLEKDNLVTETSTSLKNIAISLENEKIRQADVLFKEEFAQICRISQTFDRFVGNRQIRFIICLDASETVHREILARLIYQIHSLVLKDSTAQVAFVIEADFRVLLGEAASAILSLDSRDPSLGHVGTETVAQMLNTNMQLVHTRLHLPVFLERPLFSAVFSTKPSNPSTNTCLFPPELNHLVDSIWGTTAYPSSHRNNSHNPGTFIEMHPTACAENSINGRFPFDSQEIMISRFVQTGSNDVYRHLANLYTSNHLLADWNTKLLRQLVVSTSFTIRLLMLLQSDIPLDDVVHWMCLVHYWSFHAAWLTLYLDENLSMKESQTGLKDQVDLVACMQEVKTRVASSIAMCVPLVSGDRDVQKLDALLASRSQSMNLVNFSQLISCTLCHNPFLRYCIKVIQQTQKSNQEQTFGVLHGPISPSTLPTVAEANKRTYVSRDFHNAPVGSSETLMSVTVHPWSQDTSDERNMAKHAANQRLQNHQLVLRLEKYTTNEVCNLLASIPNIPSHRTAWYQMLFQENNINGLLLSVCDLEKLNCQLNVDTHDWWLFSEVIKGLRDRDAIKHKAFTLLDKGGVDMDEADFASLHKATEGAPFSQMCLQGLARAPENMKRSTSSSIASICATSTTQSVMHVRQTPWLTSPQLPLSGQPMETPLCPIPESTSPALLIRDDGEPDRQTSISGAEEPESLWKKTTQVANNNPGLRCSNTTYNYKNFRLHPGESVLHRRAKHHTKTTPVNDLECSIIKWMEHTNDIGFRLPEGLQPNGASHRRSVRSGASKRDFDENKANLTRLQKIGNSFHANKHLSPTMLISTSNVERLGCHHGIHLRSRSTGPIVPNYHPRTVHEHLRITGSGNESLYRQPVSRHNTVKHQLTPPSQQTHLIRTPVIDNTLRRWKKRVCRAPLDSLQLSDGNIIVNPSCAFALSPKKTNSSMNNLLTQNQDYSAALNPLTEPLSIMTLRSGVTTPYSSVPGQHPIGRISQVDRCFVEPVFQTGGERSTRTKQSGYRSSGRSYEYCRPSQRKKPRRTLGDTSKSEIAAPKDPFTKSIIQNPLCERDDDEDVLNADSISSEANVDDCDCNCLYAMSESAYNLTALSEPTLICSSIEASSEDDKMAFSAGYEVENAGTNKACI